MRERIEHREFELFYVPIAAMQVDTMTKNLPRANFERYVEAMGLIEDRQVKVLKKLYK